MLPQSNISFRQMEMEDLPFFLEVRNLVRYHLHDSREFSLADAQSWWPRKESDYYLILLAEIPIGYFRVLIQSEACILIGADIHPNFQGKKLGYLSYLKFLLIMKEKYPLHVIKLRVLKSNYRAFALYLKLGFTKLKLV